MTFRVNLYDGSGKLKATKSKLAEQKAYNVAYEWAKVPGNKSKIYNGKRLLDEIDKEKIIQRMNALVGAAIATQRALFKAKFGRDPSPDDPIFFDPEKDDPEPLPKEKIEELLNRMQQHGLGVRSES